MCADHPTLTAIATPVCHISACILQIRTLELHNNVDIRMKSLHFNPLCSRCISTRHCQSHGGLSQSISAESQSPGAFPDMQIPSHRRYYMAYRKWQGQRWKWWWISSEGRAVSSWPSGGNPVCMQSKRWFTADRLHKNPISCRPNPQCLLLQTVWGSQFSARFAKVNFGHIRVDWLGVTLCRFSLEKTPQLCPKQYKQHGRQILGPPLENDFHTYKWMQLP